MQAAPRKLTRSHSTSSDDLEDAKELYDDIHDYLDILTDILKNVEEEEGSLPPAAANFLSEYKSYTASNTAHRSGAKSRRNTLWRHSFPMAVTTPGRSLSAPAVMERSDAMKRVTIARESPIAKLEHVMVNATFSRVETASGENGSISPSVRLLQDTLNSCGAVQKSPLQQYLQSVGGLSFLSAFMVARTREEQSRTAGTKSRAENNGFGLTASVLDFLSSLAFNKATLESKPAADLISRDNIDDNEARQGPVSRNEFESSRYNRNRSFRASLTFSDLETLFEVDESDEASGTYQEQYYDEPESTQESEYYEETEQDGYGASESEFESDYPAEEVSITSQTNDDDAQPEILAQTPLYDQSDASTKRDDFIQEIKSEFAKTIHAVSVLSSWRFPKKDPAVPPKDRRTGINNLFIQTVNESPEEAFRPLPSPTPSDKTFVEDDQSMDAQAIDRPASFVSLPPFSDKLSLNDQSTDAKTSGASDPTADKKKSGGFRQRLEFINDIVSFTKTRLSDAHAATAARLNYWERPVV